MGRRDTSTPSMQISYPRKGVWSGNNQLGVELPFTPDQTFIQTIFKLDEWGFPETWTISLGFIFERDLVEDEVFDAIAEVDFGSGGIVQSFEVDWVDGTMFSLPMNAVNVRARWNDLAVLAGLLPPSGVRLSVIAARHGLRHARATRTLFLSVPPAIGIIPGSSALVRIPNFAKSVVITPNRPGDAAALYSATTSLQFLSNTDPLAPNPVLTVPGTFLGPTASFKVPIPAFAHYWRVVNAAAAPAAIQGAAVFNLFDE